MKPMVNTLPEGKELFSRSEAAEYLRISVRKLDYLAESGAIRYVKLGSHKTKGARVLYRKCDVEKFIEQHVLDISSEVNNASRKAAEILKVRD